MNRFPTASRPVADSEPALAALLEQLREQYRGAVNCALVYGSCLRSGDLHDGLLDLYLICDDYRSAYGSGLLAAANRERPQPASARAKPPQEEKAQPASAPATTSNAKPEPPGQGKATRQTNTKAKSGTAPTPPKKARPTKAKSQAATASDKKPPPETNATAS